MAKREFPVSEEKVKEENEKKVEEPVKKPKKYSGVTKGS